MMTIIQNLDAEIKHRVGLSAPTSKGATMAKLDRNQRRRQLIKLAPPLPDDPRPDAAGEYETFGDDERLAREHAEYFYEGYWEDAGYRR
jgi:hypothetical protein